MCVCEIGTVEPTLSSADCDFNNGTLCRWMPDPRDGGGRWGVEDKSLCLSPNAADPFADNFDDIDDNGAAAVISNPTARLWSRTIRTLGGARVLCLTLKYRFEVLNASLMLLRHSLG